MKKKSWVLNAPFIKKSLVLALSLTLMACSGNDGNTMTDVSGVVIDGYLENAKVCLDMNGNMLCDNNEPFAMTNVKGEYTFQAGVSDVNNYRIIAMIGKDTKDSDKPNETLSNAVYSTPVGERVITPLTTLVAYKLRISTEVTSVAAEEEKIKMAFALNDNVSLFVDHVKKSAEGNDAYKALHEAAKKVAPQLGSDESIGSIPEIMQISSGMDMSDMSDGMDMSGMTGKMDMGDMSDGMDMTGMTGKMDMVDMSGGMDMTGMTGMTGKMDMGGDMSGMEHFRAVLEHFDPVNQIDMTTMMTGMSHLTAELEGFDAVIDINMETMKPGMQHLRDVLAHFDESTMPSSGVDNMAAMSGDMSKMSEMKGNTDSKEAVPECPEGQRWYFKGEIPGMAAMCMP